jgi:hypothetical protein
MPAGACVSAWRASLNADFPGMAVQSLGTLVGLFPNDADRASECRGCQQATFAARVTAPDDLTVLFNTAEAARTPVEGDASLSQRQFPATPVMSTYVVAFVVGNLTSTRRSVRSTLNHGKTSYEVAVWGTPDRCAPMSYPARRIGPIVSYCLESNVLFILLSMAPRAASKAPRRTFGRERSSWLILQTVPRTNHFIDEFLWPTMTPFKCFSLALRASLLLHVPSLRVPLDHDYRLPPFPTLHPHRVL